MKSILTTLLALTLACPGATYWLLDKNTEGVGSKPKVTAAVSSLFGLDGSGTLAMVPNSTFQAADADLTAYAEAADSLARRSLIGLGLTGTPTMEALTVTDFLGTAEVLFYHDTTHADILAPAAGAASRTFSLPATSGTLALTSQITGTNSGTNTGDITLGTVGATPAAEGASLVGQVLTLQPASATHPGVVTTGAQVFAGDKTMSGGLRVEGLADFADESEFSGTVLFEGAAEFQSVVGFADTVSFSFDGGAQASLRSAIGVGFVEAAEIADTNGQIPIFDAIDNVFYPKVLTGDVLIDENGVSSIPAATTFVDPDADALVKWDDSASEMIGATAGTDYVTPTGTETLTNKSVNGVTLSGSAVTATIPATGTVALRAANTFTGVQTLTAGAVGAPSINFGDATTGFYQQTTDRIGVTTAGTLKAVFYSSGMYMASGAIGVNTANWFRIGAGGVELTTTAGGGTYAPLYISNLIASGTLAVTGTSTFTGGSKLGATVVGSLPAAASNTYLELIVTDSLAPVAGSTVAAGGSAKCKVCSNGSAWIVTATL